MFLSVLAAAAIAPRLAIGTEWSGQETLRFHSKESQIEETHRFKLVFKVTGLADKMWTVSRASTLLGTVVDGTELPPPPYNEPEVRTERLSPAGFLLDLEPFEKGLFHLDRMLHFWLPDNLPEEWSASLTTNLDHFTTKGRAEFKLIGKKGEDSREYSFTYESLEDPVGMMATGQMRFDVKSGRLLVGRIEAVRAQLPGGTERANVTLNYRDSRM